MYMVGPGIRSFLGSRDSMSKVWQGCLDMGEEEKEEEGKVPKRSEQSLVPHRLASLSCSHLIPNPSLNQLQHSPSCKSKSAWMDKEAAAHTGDLKEHNLERAEAGRGIPMALTILNIKPASATCCLLQVMGSVRQLLTVSPARGPVDTRHCGPWLSPPCSLRTLNSAELLLFKRGWELDLLGSNGLRGIWLLKSEEVCLSGLRDLRDQGSASGKIISCLIARIPGPQHGYDFRASFHCRPDQQMLPAECSGTFTTLTKPMIG
ncbi:uncharacterized protein LOC128316100 [Acinonyx jubatus]|uniref:Uncharacterized protein LOC128316100 n=1 Tax=Acinonyx jubatus TaxID=32536 RepID=A0ABM3QA59_ACIJB|nr:uncharacterized protein LOC128316100 [Acinonyx jubatus]